MAVTTALLGLALALPGAWRQAGIDPHAAREAFAEARELCASDAGALWGVELDGPLMFLDRGSGRVAANRPDPGGELEEAEGVFVGARPPEIVLANTAQTWDGVAWTTVLWPLPRDGAARRRLLAHELFHRVQERVPASVRTDAPNPHLDTRDGRTWLRLEWRALARALETEGAERRAALVDALDFRAHRHALFPGASEAEALLERNEGLAEYTGWKLCGLPEDELPGRIAARLLWDERMDPFTRSFAYACGPAWAILLDQPAVPGPEEPPRTAGAWRRSQLADLAASVRAHFGIERRAGELDPQALLRRGEAYGVSEVLAEERAREERRQERLAFFRRRFLEGPVLSLPATEALRFTYDPTAVQGWEGYGQVYPTLELSDVWGRLQVSSLGALLVRDEAGAIVEARVPAPLDGTETTLSGEGYTLEIADGHQVVPHEREGDLTLAASDG